MINNNLTYYFYNKYIWHMHMKDVKEENIKSKCHEYINTTMNFKEAWNNHMTQ